MAIEHQVAYIDHTGPANAAAVAAIQADIQATLGEVNLVWRQPGPDIHPETTVRVPDVDPLDDVVYCFDGDTAVKQVLGVLGITPRSIDALLVPGRDAPSTVQQQHARAKQARH